MLRVWGCRAYHTVTNGRAKLDDKAVPLVFIGYDGDTAAYRLFDSATRKTVRSRNARFVEDEIPFAAATPSTAQSLPQPAHAPDDLIILPSSQAPSAANDATPQTPARAPPVVPRPPLDFLGNDPFGATLAEVEALYSAAGEDLSASDEQFSLPMSDPRNHREAMRDTDSERWRLGEHDEFTFLQNEYNVFHPVDRSEVPPDAKILGARFVYRRKKDQNGHVTGHKVRLVAQGFTQRPNVDFRETFAPVVKFTSVRVLHALAARHRLHVHQANVDKAYLHGALAEELYMRVPEGIDGSDYAGKVLKLDRALYGLKQAGPRGGHTHYIALYVDDLLFVSPDLDEIQRIKDGLKREYGIKDLGEAKFILGIQVHRRLNGGIFLSQRAYLEDVLLRLGYADGRTAPTPMQPNLQLAVALEDHQPNPAFRSRYLQAVDNSHWAAVIRVLAYIKGTLDFGLEFQPDNSPLAGFEAYSDSDWGACPSTSRSTMGYTFVLASGAFSWSSKLQPRVTASSTEAEYLGLSHASKEAIHLSQLFSTTALATVGSPLHERFRLARPAAPKIHPSPIHLALHSSPTPLPPESRVEKVQYSPLAPWSKPPRCRVVVAESKDESVVAHDAEVARLEAAGGLVAYSDGSLIGGRAGAAAVVRLSSERSREWGEKGRGMGQHQSIYAAELEGARLALHAVTGILAQGAIDTGTLFLDNQSAARSPFDPAPTPGQTTRLALRSLALQLEQERPEARLTVQWLAGHHGVAGNEAADEVAKRATGELSDASAGAAVPSEGKRRGRARRGMLQGFKPEQSEQESASGDESDWDEGEEKRARDFERRLERRRTDDLATDVGPDGLVPGGHELPKSLSSLKQAQNAANIAAWALRWMSPSSPGQGLRDIDPRPPGKSFVQQGNITVTYIPTARMVADVMTKSLPLPAFIQHRLS
ncbi:hypothetical protein B0A53_04422 [Rhodotorula sp. CCFEE 5036]|nr:hypothetical protein B0A53_04422 [Rhodotorula sp. CCFEE 5036]